MPKLRTTIADTRKAFQQEVRMKRAYYNIMQQDIADTLGVAQSRVSTLMANPDQLSAGRLREIITMLKLDPIVVLSFLGYSQKEIKKLKEI